MSHMLILGNGYNELYHICLKRAIENIEKII
jgi:hypothetical protein